MKLRSRK